MPDPTMSQVRALKAAATRLGLTAEAYAARIVAGEKWCSGCKAWHAITAFGRDRRRTDGRKATCPAADRQRYVRTYVRKADRLEAM